MSSSSTSSSALPSLPKRLKKAVTPEVGEQFNNMARLKKVTPEEKEPQISLAQQATNLARQILRNQDLMNRLLLRMAMERENPRHTFNRMIHVNNITNNNSDDGRRDYRYSIRLASSPSSTPASKSW
jgi:hypothetical protein